MVKAINPNLRMASISKKMKKIIKNPAERPFNMTVVTRFAKEGGQVRQKKTLPNGNIQERLITVYDGERNAIALETIQYSPEGKGIRYYAGERTSPYVIEGKNGRLIQHTGTEIYASGNSPYSVRGIVKDIHDGSSIEKRLI